LALSHLPGQSLDVLLAQGGSLRTVLWESGRALARLHNGPRAGGERDSARTRPGSAAVSRAAAETAAQLSGLCPELAPRVRRLLDELAAGAPVAGEPVFCHGDFSTDQVVVDGEGRPGLIDWDHAGWGDPASDLASAEAAGLTGDALEDFLEGYRELRPPVRGRWHQAHARLMRVLDPFRSGRPAWRSDVAANLATIERTLCGDIR
jgi:aminoglycoside phosphotransferase (APT) family kinase protein